MMFLPYSIIIAGLVAVAIIGAAFGAAIENRRNARFQIRERYRRAEGRTRAFGV